jgi:hypothetical protein
LPVDEGRASDPGTIADQRDEWFYSIIPTQQIKAVGMRNEGEMLFTMTLAAC